MKKQKMTPKEKNIMKNGPCFDQLIAEVMFHDQVCAHVAIANIVGFLSLQLAKNDKKQTLELLNLISKQVKKQRKGK